MIRHNASTALPTPRGRLVALKSRLDRVATSWTVDDYRSLVAFYVDILPVIMACERCTVFIIEPGTEKLCSMIGTGLEETRIEPPMHGSIVGQVIRGKTPVIANDMAAQGGYHTEVEKDTGFQTRNVACVPIISLTGHGVSGAVQLVNKQHDQSFDSEDEKKLVDIARFLSISIESILLNQEIISISEQVNREMGRITKDASPGMETFVVESQAMRRVLSQIPLLCETPVDVLIQGENGTGKELLARMLHDGSNRGAQPFVAVNCAAVPVSLAESEFFGYEKGAFTGADTQRRGLFETAHKGTLFLDEIAELPLAIQPKFLRALQEGEALRLGGNKPVHFDVRIISATNRDLDKDVSEGLFRQDLFYRLFAVDIKVPPLRKRRPDIVPLALHFLDQICRHYKRQIPGFLPEVLALFLGYSWPGNVRQLRREVERLVALTPEGERLSLEKCSPEILGTTNAAPLAPVHGLPHTNMPLQVQALEVRLIKEALTRSRNNRHRAAQLLGISRQGLYKKMKRLKLDL